MDIKFTIDGKECVGQAGQTILEAARDNRVYIPSLCNYQGLKASGSCRICTVRVAGRYMSACTQPLTPGIAVENSAPDLEDMRRALIEMLFAEGNHFCPACEKSGNCELQALAYRYRMLVPRFPYQYPVKPLSAADPKIILDNNRCVQCRRCVASVKSEDGRNVFGMLNRSRRTLIAADPELLAKLTETQARQAMDICPVGAIIRKEVGFAVPIGRRKYDTVPIGSDIESPSPGGRS